MVNGTMKRWPHWIVWCNSCIETQLQIIGFCWVSSVNFAPKHILSIFCQKKRYTGDTVICGYICTHSWTNEHTFDAMTMLCDEIGKYLIITNVENSYNDISITNIIYTTRLHEEFWYSFSLYFKWNACQSTFINVPPCIVQFGKFKNSFANLPPMIL